MLLLVMCILVPLMVSSAQRESVWTAKQAKDTKAFHLAEAGQEKAFLAVSLSSSVWQKIQGGGAGALIPGFHFDQAYSDVPGGTYTISITSGPAANQATIISVGRDSLKHELRTLKTVYSVTSIASSASVYAGQVKFTNTGNAILGPIMSTTQGGGSGTFNITNGSMCSPQIWAVSSITSSINKCSSCVPAYSGDARCTTSNFSAPASPCTDGVSYWAFNCSPGLPAIPQLDLASYKALAQADHCTESGQPAGASPAGSCYWPPGANPSWSHNPNCVFTSSHTYYVDSAPGWNFNLSDSCCFYGTFLVPNGNFSDSSGGACPAYTIPDWLSPGGIDPNAWKQYQLVDSGASSEYYGDAGYQSVSASFQFAAPGGTQMKDGTTDVIAFRGLVYAGGTFQISNSANVHGIVMAPNGLATITNTGGVYYDADTSKNVKWLNAHPTRVWWQEVAYGAWPGP